MSDIMLLFANRGKTAIGLSALIVLVSSPREDDMNERFPHKQE